LDINLYTNYKYAILYIVFGRLAMKFCEYVRTKHNRSEGYKRGWKLRHEKLKKEKVTKPLIGN